MQMDSNCNSLQLSSLPAYSADFGLISFHNCMSKFLTITLSPTPFLPGRGPLSAPRPPTLLRRSRPSQERPHFLPPQGRASPALNTPSHSTYKESQTPSNFNRLLTPARARRLAGFSPSRPQPAPANQKPGSGTRGPGPTGWVPARPRWVGRPGAGPGLAGSTRCGS